mgnify:CR=1 FL=1
MTQLYTIFDKPFLLMSIITSIMMLTFTTPAIAQRVVIENVAPLQSPARVLGPTMEFLPIAIPLMTPSSQPKLIGSAQKAVHIKNVPNNIHVIIPTNYNGNHINKLVPAGSPEASANHFLARRGLLTK